MEFYKEVLISEYSKKQKKNPAYSLRSFSKFLGLAQATLSEVMRDKRKLPLKHAIPVAEKLNLDPSTKTMFVKSVELSKASLKNLELKTDHYLDETVLDEQRDYNIIAYWEYYGLLNLIETKDFINDEHWIAKRLDIKVSRVSQVKKELIARGYLKEEQGNLTRIQTKLTTSQDVFSKALRHSHKESLEMAIEKIDSVHLDKRFLSSSTIPVSMEKMDEAKKLIREFRAKMTALLAEGDKEEVYQFCIQLYPLTNSVEKGELQ